MIALACPSNKENVMPLLFDNVFPHGHQYNNIPWEITDNPVIIMKIVETMRQSFPEAIDVIAGLLNRLDSRGIGLQHICGHSFWQEHRN